LISRQPARWQQRRRRRGALQRRAAADAANDGSSNIWRATRLRGRFWSRASRQTGNSGLLIWRATRLRGRSWSRATLWPLRTWVDAVPCAQSQSPLVYTV